MQKIKLDNEKKSDIQWFYSQDWEYYDYGNCKRHLQILFPYKHTWNDEEKFPLILFIPGSAWHKQEMYNDIPQYAKLSGVILESASTDILICAKAPLPPWMKLRPSAVLLGVEQIEGNDAHGGAVFYCDEMLRVLKAFCEIPDRDWNFWRREEWKSLV